MPYYRNYEPPEMFFEYKGIEIYYYYPDDNIDDPSHNTYVIGEYEDDFYDKDFCISTAMKLINTDDIQNYYKKADAIKIIERLIDAGYITKDGWVDDPEPILEIESIREIDTLTIPLPFEELMV